MPGVIKCESIGQTGIDHMAALEVDKDIRGKQGIEEVFKAVAKKVAPSVKKQKKEKTEGTEGDDNSEMDQYCIVSANVPGNGNAKKRRKTESDGSSDEDVFGDVMNFTAMTTTSTAGTASTAGGKGAGASNADSDMDSDCGKGLEEGDSESDTATRKSRKLQRGVRGRHAGGQHRGNRGSGTRKSNRKSGNGGAGTGLKVADARRQAASSDSPGGSFKEKVKHVTAMHTARLVLQSCEHLFENMSDAQMMPRTTVKHVQDIQAKVGKALAPDNVSLYMLASEDSASSASPGLQVLEKLRAAEGKLQRSVDLLRCVNAQEGPDSSAGAMMAAYLAARDSIVMPVLVLETVLTRALHSAVGDEENFMQLVTLPDPSETQRNTQDDIDAISIAMLPVECRSDFQAKAIAKIAASVFRKPAGDKSSTDVAKLFTTLTKCRIGSEKIKQQVAWIATMGKVTDSQQQGEVDMKELSEAHSGIVRDTEGFFYKGLTLFDTGLAFKRAVEVLLDAYKKDMPYVPMLESVRGNIKHVKPLTKSQVTIKDKDGELKINSKGMRASICTQFLIIQANASVNFRSRNLEAYQDVEDRDVGKTKS